MHVLHVDMVLFRCLSHSLSPVEALHFVEYCVYVSHDYIIVLLLDMVSICYFAMWPIHKYVQKHLHKLTVYKALRYFR